MSSAKIFSNVIREWGQSVQTGNVNGLHRYPALLEQVHDIGEQLQHLGVEMESELDKSQERLSMTMLSMKAQAATDLLHRGLFERTADVGAMAENAMIREILSKGPMSDEDRQTLSELLKNYVYEYSIYDDVIILDAQGRTFASLNGAASPDFFGSLLFNEAVQTDGYSEHFYFTPRPVLYYAQKILGESRQLLGLMVLSFQFEYEMEQEIFPDVLNGETGMDLLMITSDRRVAASTTEFYPVGSVFPTLTGDKLMLGNDEYDVTVQDTNGYEGYMGFGLQGVALKQPDQKKVAAKNTAKKVNQEAVPKSLKRIITNVESVETDLHIVGLNGKLQAGREDDKTLPPILDGIRDSGAKIRTKFQEVIGDLVEDTEVILQQKANAISKMAMVVMDHNLYERCNDVCWWADSAIYRRTLAQTQLDEGDIARLQRELAATNELYTVYEHLFIFDRNGVIVTDSKPEYGHRFVGHNLEGNVFQETLRNKDPKKYFISNFEKTILYGDRDTYVYCATVFAPDSNEVVGGIGLVFDSEVQFQAILEECLENENNTRDGDQAFGVYVNARGVIVASCDEDFPVGKRFDMADIDASRYIVRKAKSVGYREYLRNDGHKPDKYCLIAIPRG